MNELIETLKDKINHYQTDQPIPAWIKSAAAILVTMILGIILFVFMDDESSETLEIDKTRASSNEPTLKDQQTGIPLKKAMMHDLENTPKTIFDAEKTKITAIKKISEHHSKQLASIEKLVNQLQTQINLITDEYPHYGAEIEDIHTQLVSLKSEQQKIQKELPNKVTPIKRKRTASTRPPFKLVSIDIWGSDASIIVRREKKLHDLSLGQSLGKWQVESIDKKGAKVIFRNKYGTKRTLFVES